MVISFENQQTSGSLKAEDPLVHLMIYTFFLDIFFILQHLCLYYCVAKNAQFGLKISPRPDIIFKDTCFLDVG